ncbi:MAG: ABC transporter permease [Methanobacteriaceae archaeon]|nr:ABC transporter permease [Methanobacteriaceae archaeon]MDZ4172780.1 ABC transporter permease [Methanobacteriaceae archaeon]
MKYRNLILKNIFRNKARSSLAMIGIAIGIATILGLGLVTDGLSTSTEQALTAGAADFSVVSASPNGQGGGPGGFGGSQQLINETTVNKIAQISGVESVAGVLRSSISDDSTNNTDQQPSSSNPDQPSMRMPTTVLGIDSKNLEMYDVKVTNGSAYSSANEVVIGKTAADNQNKTIGDTVSISNQTFKIVGIYETGETMQDNGIIMSLTTLQNITNNTGKVSSILVKTNDSSNADKTAQSIESKYSDLSTSTSLSGMDRMNSSLDIIKSAVWGISLLAILIGGIIVVITMLKSVSERTREIGVLKAVGWTKKWVMVMIIGESLILALIASIVGILIGVGVVEILSLFNILQFIQPTYSLTLFLKALGIGLLMGVIGGLYPAYRASRLAPTEALRYE